MLFRSDRKSTRLNSSHLVISYAVFCLKKKKQPSHDPDAAIPYDDFDVNALGTMTRRGPARDFCREAPFCCTSTNKVFCFFLNDPPPTEIYTLSHHAALPV